MKRIQTFVFFSLCGSNAVLDTEEKSLSRIFQAWYLCDTAFTTFSKSRNMNCISIWITKNKNQYLSQLSQNFVLFISKKTENILLCVKICDSFVLCVTFYCDWWAHCCGGPREQKTGKRKKTHSRRGQNK